MKLAKRKIPSTIEGQAVSLLPEDPEDMVRHDLTTEPRPRHTLAREC